VRELIEIIPPVDPGVRTGALRESRIKSMRLQHLHGAARCCESPMAGSRKKRFTKARNIFNSLSVLDLRRSTHPRRALFAASSRYSHARNRDFVPLPRYLTIEYFALRAGRRVGVITPPTRGAPQPGPVRPSQSPPAKSIRQACGSLPRGRG
jgi:hypothetical protein